MFSHCDIHTFEITGGFKWHLQKLAASISNIHLHPYGIAVSNNMSARVHTLQTIIDNNKHNNLIINIFKMDIEGSEYSVLKSMLERSELINVKQLVIEFHYNRVIEKQDHIHHEIFELLHHAGFAIMAKEPNIMYTDGSCIEYSFVNLSPRFFHRAL